MAWKPAGAVDGSSPTGEPDMPGGDILKVAMRAVDDHYARAYDPQQYRHWRIKMTENNDPKVTAMDRPQLPLRQPSTPDTPVAGVGVPIAPAGTNGKQEIGSRTRVSLRCESMLQMAFTMWMQEVRGAAPFIGPMDMWRLNEMKAILFSIGEKNDDF
jgi:hypothetical protein